jgi:crossover junction endodeoxyribonuclease RuvC
MRVIGIDCGIAITGWAILESNKSGRSKVPKVVNYGVIKTKAGIPMSDRLVKLSEELTKLVNKYKPECAAIENLFYFKNQKTIISVSQARGVSILAVASKGIEVHDYTPLQVKQAITGYGRATKEQMQRMIKTILKLEKIPKPDDAADALAIAFCHLSTIKY